MTLDEATARFIAGVAASGRPSTWDLTPVQARAGGEALRQMVGPGPEMHDVWDQAIASASGRDVRVRFLVPVAEPAGVLVYAHGGGWVIGTIDEFDTLGRQIAQASGWIVVLVDYAKAPEAPFPAGLEDMWSAVTGVDSWRNDRANFLPLAVAGDSAGANLATVCARRAVERGGPDLALQVLVYPVVDCAMDTGSYADPANQLLLEQRSMRWFWDHYHADVATRVDPDLSPLRAVSLAGVAPAVVITAEHDVLRDEGEAYAARLEEVGALRSFRRYGGQMHGFFSMANLLPGSARAVDQIAAELSEINQAGTP
jgi:acetyl esterase